MANARANAAAGDLGKELHFLRTESLTTVIQREIERMILSGELSAGEPINENMLSARLSISRGPIREACRKLEQAVLLQFHVNRGMFVRKLDLEDVLHLYEIRAALAELAGKLLPKGMSPETHRHLSELIDQMDDAIEANGVDGYYPLNLEFHKALMDSTGNPRLASMFGGTDKELHVFRRQSLVSVRGLRQSNNEHRYIVNALCTGDAEQVGQAMKRHILGGRGRLLKSIGKQDLDETMEGTK